MSNYLDWLRFGVALAKALGLDAREWREELNRCLLLIG